MTSPALLASAMAGLDESSNPCPRRHHQPKWDTSSDALHWANAAVRKPRRRWSELDDFSPEWRMAPRPDLLGCVGRMHSTKEVCPLIRERTLCNPLNLAGSVTGGTGYPPLPRHYTSERIPYDLHGLETMPLDEWPGCDEPVRPRPQTAACSRSPRQQPACCQRPKTCRPVRRNHCPCPQHPGNCMSSVGAAVVENVCFILTVPDIGGC